MGVGVAWQRLCIAWRRQRAVRCVDAEERLAVGADDLAQRGDPGGGVARGQLHLPRVVGVEQLQVARDLVRVRGV